ncbi:ABC transporter permease [Halovulum dunhuangense]|uniref:ABC transporter permease n=1 Tax=Halovulum dunhuangense TaxID=1505036 RepID=A0A849L4M5_9RHOB|nr:ABC transporter permease [Halovulum dunhuangense]NNU81305.1 ABC transporter permease [Halovulum dunhuangense]
MDRLIPLKPHAVTLTAILGLIVFAVAGGLNPVSLSVSIIAAATPLMLASLGEMVVEKSGVLNLGVEGMTIIGAIAGFAIAVETGSPLLGLVAAAAAGAALSLIFGVLTQLLLSNQVATGLALTLFGLGLAALIGQPYSGIKPPAFPRLDIPLISDIPVIGPILFSHDLLTYLALAVLGGIWWFLYRSRAGLVLRACGEGHDAAHALGYDVIRIRLAAIAFGGACAGLGGAGLSLIRVPQWTEGMTAGAGWIALAIVVFGMWRPGRVALGAYLFGGVTILQLNLQAAGITPLWLLVLALLLLSVHVTMKAQRRAMAPLWLGTLAMGALALVYPVSIQTQYLSMAPYLCTILVLVVMSADRLRANLNAPASLGRVFVRTA